MDHFDRYSILITGGLGFIGSNLALRLVDLGASVILVDSLIPDYDCNRFAIQHGFRRFTAAFRILRDHDFRRSG